jgi:hypothetical protein
VSDDHAPEAQGSSSHQAFAALREAGVIDGELCRRLTRAQDARSMIEHGYIETSAGRVHQTAELVRDTSRDFIGRYRTWVELALAERIFGAAEVERLRARATGALVPGVARSGAVGERQLAGDLAQPRSNAVAL